MSVSLNSVKRVKGEKKASERERYREGGGGVREGRVVGEGGREVEGGGVV